MDITNMGAGELAFVLVVVFIGLLWLIFFTWLIFWGTKKNNFLAIFVGVLFTGIFWGLIWVVIAYLSAKIKQKEAKKIYKEKTINK